MWGVQQDLGGLVWLLALNPGAQGERVQTQPLTGNLGMVNSRGAQCPLLPPFPSPHIPGVSGGQRQGGMKTWSPAEFRLQHWGVFATGGRTTSACSTPGRFKVSGVLSWVYFPCGAFYKVMTICTAACLSALNNLLLNSLFVLSVCLFTPVFLLWVLPPHLPCFWSGFYTLPASSWFKISIFSLHLADALKVSQKSFLFYFTFPSESQTRKILP